MPTVPLLAWLSLLTELLLLLLSLLLAKLMPAL
jgi:hypothetical protein